MNFIVIGTNHKHSPIELRERISFSKKRIVDALLLLKEKSFLNGAVILSTCNRIEIYATTEDSENGLKKLEDFISQFHEIKKEDLFFYLYRYEGKEAIRHLFSVASGLDSLILGETQIRGQVQFAFDVAQSASSTDSFLKSIFNSALYVAKKAQSETRISEGKISVGSVAIEFIKERVGDLLGSNILIVGMGKVNELVLEYLKKEKPEVIFISSRNFKKAKELATRIQARAVQFDKLKEYLKKADVVISATASPHFIIRQETLKDIRQRLLILDLALPRDVDPKVKVIKNIELFCLEDISSIISKNTSRKFQEANKAYALIDKEVVRLCPKLTESEPEPALLP